MFIKFDREIKDIKDLGNYLRDKSINLPEFDTAVIAMLMDKNENIILQRRGPKSRDSYNMLSDIGGAVEKEDKNFREALCREIMEEVGNEINYCIDKLVGGCLLNRYDSRREKYVNWLFLLYKCTYINGELCVNEPGKSIGYEYYKYNDLPKEEVLESTLSFWNWYMKNKV